VTDPHASMPLDDGQVDRIITAMTAPDDPEQGRLDRILAGQREEHAAAEALENENAALTGPLEALTHEFSGGLSGRCKRVLRFALGGESGCWFPAEHPVHRTPARMRAELEGPLWSKARSCSRPGC
jgi:hypothetical protein